jgi:hypothetical protein
VTCASPQEEDRGSRRAQSSDHTITGMGFPYIMMLTAFCVDNGKNLPADLLIMARGRRALTLGARKCRR